MIKDLYINFVGPGEKNQRNYLLNDRVDKIIKELQKELKNKHKRKLERLCSDYQEINLIDTEQAFTRGFAFAVQLLSEAFGEKL